MLLGIKKRTTFVYIVYPETSNDMPAKQENLRPVFETTKKGEMHGNDLRQARCTLIQVKALASNSC
jgi:O-phosphoseryl-tRNA(Cys) synthetase